MELTFRGIESAEELKSGAASADEDIVLEIPKYLQTELQRGKKRGRESDVMELAFQSPELEEYWRKYVVRNKSEYF